MEAGQRRAPSTHSETLPACLGARERGPQLESSLLQPSRAGTWSPTTRATQHRCACGQVHSECSITESSGAAASQRNQLSIICEVPAAGSEGLQLTRVPGTKCTWSDALHGDSSVSFTSWGKMLTYSEFSDP